MIERGFAAMDNTSTNILARMEDRRKELVGKACEELSKWENCLNKSTEEKEKYSGKPEKLEEYAIAETKANAARENINRLKLDILKLQQRKYPLATPEETKDFYNRVYIESLAELQEIAKVFFDYYKLLIELSNRAATIGEKATRAAKTWDKEISLKNSGKYGLNGNLILPGVMELSNNSLYSAHENYTETIHRIKKALDGVTAALDRMPE